MKKTIILATAAALLALCLTSCKKDDDNGRRLTQFTAGLERVASQQDAKAYLDDNLIKWRLNDTIAVIDAGNRYSTFYSTAILADPTWAEFTITDGEHSVLGEGPYKAYYPSRSYDKVIRSLYLSTTQESVDGSLSESFPMYGESTDGETFQFKNICGVLKIHLQQADATVSSIIIKSDQYISGWTYVNVTDGIPTVGLEDYSSFYSTALILDTPQSIGGQGHDFYIFLPPSTTTGYNLQMIIIQPDGSRCTKSCDGVIVERSKYTNITTTSLTFETPVAPQGTLCGLFTCSAAGDMLAFAPGNLVATTTGGAPGEDNTVWSFHQHQYDITGEANSVNGTCDLFGWSTASTYYGLSESQDRNSYSGAYVDWGTAMGQGWITPTFQQWLYIINSRPNAKNLRGAAVIQLSESQTVSGHVILPDRWVLPEGCTFDHIDATTGTMGTPNSYTADQWALMEANGALFIPFAGIRYGDTYLADASAEVFWALYEDLNIMMEIIFEGTGNAYGYPGSSAYYGYPVRLAKAVIAVSGDASSKGIRR